MILKPFKGASYQNITQTFHQFHKAIDWFPAGKLATAYGFPLVAPEKCKVKKVYTSTKITDLHEEQPNTVGSIQNGYGLWMVGLETGYEHLYWHTLPILPVNEGDIVEKGQIVAYCGNSGNVISGTEYVPIEERTTSFKGVHLHQAVLKDGVAINPLTVIDMETEPTYSFSEWLNSFVIVLGKISKLL